MVFKCQQDSFLKEFSSKVVSCEEINQNVYEVILEDTIFFPTGGGQPCDYGVLNGIPVKEVVRRDDKAIHTLEKPLKVGESVKQCINWNRRFDHMQQHSGQHLITAIIDREFKYNTVSWYLGANVSYIELETPTISQEDIKKVEDICNELIRDGKPVFVDVLDKASEETLTKFRSTRGLPQDHKGDIRIVTIEGVESNMCCGTHVSNLSQLQMVKMLHSEKSKRKGKTLLYFLIGNRILYELSECLQREQKLVTILKANPIQHPQLIEKSIQNSKSLNKDLHNVLKDLALCEAQNLKSNKNKYFILHRKEGDMGFMNMVLKEGGRTDIFCFLSVGNNMGDIIMTGNDTDLSVLAPKICDLLDGKGSIQGGRFQAKVKTLSKLKFVESLLKDYFNK